MELANELDIGLDSVVFLDNDPVACAEVQSTCPEVVTCLLPPRVEDIAQFLRHVWAFDRLVLTGDDVSRAARYRQGAARARALRQSLTFGEFIDSLGLDIQIAPLEARHLSRAAQLTQRTNQFNCTTIRRSDRDIQRLCELGAVEALIVSVTDRFGDYGQVGLLMFRAQASALVVDTWLLSCRALGRGVEHRMLAKLGEIACERGLAFVDVPFVPTAKNHPARAFLEAVGVSRPPQAANSCDFSIPAARAAATVFTPACPPPRSSTAMDDASSTGRGAPPREDGHSRSAHARIATELQSVDQILAAIQSRRQRTRPDLTTGLTAARTAVEETLASIWTRVLNVSPIGIHDDFVELGGHSLLATILLSRVRDAFQVDIALHDFFADATVAGLARGSTAVGSSWPTRRSLQGRWRA